MSEVIRERLTVEFRNRIGSFLGAVGVLLVLGALLLGSSDFFAGIARAVSSLLGTFGIQHTLALPPPPQEASTGPILPELIPTVVPSFVRHSITSVLASALGTVAAVVVAVRARAHPLMIGVAGFAGTVLTTTLLAAAYGNAVVDGPIDRVVVDWRTSPLLPVALVVVVMGYSLYPIGRALPQKVAWTIVGAAATVAFGVLRLTLVTAALAEFGPNSILPMFAIAGSWLDVIPALAVLGIARYGASVSSNLIDRVSWFR